MVQTKTYPYAHKSVDQQLKHTNKPTNISYNSLILDGIPRLQREIGNLAIGRNLRSTVLQQTNPSQLQSQPISKNQQLSRRNAPTGISLHGPVGALTGTSEQGNFAEDVVAVKSLLRKLGFAPSLDLTGSINQELIDGIKKFQRLFTKSADGRVDPGGATFRKLTELAIGKIIVVNLARQVIDAYLDSSPVFHFDCVAGDSDHPTTPGIHKVYRREQIYRSKKYDAQMNYAIFYHGGEAIHMAFAVGISSFFKSLGASWLGSHGCVRLSEENAKQIFNWVPMNTPVVVLPAE